MIKWLTGNTGAGKTTLANKLKRESNQPTVILDGTILRGIWVNVVGFSQEDRWQHNHRVANLALMINNQGINVIVAVICPYERLRMQVQKICGCEFIYVKGGLPADDTHPYEIPVEPCEIYDWRNLD